MNATTVRKVLHLQGRDIEVAIDPAQLPPDGHGRGVALICHPHPLFDGTMDNKVVQTLARAHVQTGWTSWRFNFRGVGRSAGAWDQGKGEVDDAAAVLAEALRRHAASGSGAASVAVAGFSFGAYVASQLVRRLTGPLSDVQVARATLVAPAVVNFEVVRLPAGALVVHGSADDVVPLQAVLRWADAQAGHATDSVQPVVVFPGVGHFFHGQLGLLKQAVVDHLQSLNAPRA
jgi:uncharacterized protein